MPQKSGKFHFKGIYGGARETNDFDARRARQRDKKE